MNPNREVNLAGPLSNRTRSAKEAYRFPPGVLTVPLSRPYRDIPVVSPNVTAKSEDDLPVDIYGAFPYTAGQSCPREACDEAAERRECLRRSGETS